MIFLLDCGRMMAGDTGKGLSPLDHALNAMLMLAHVALIRGDQVGVLAFSDGIKAYIPPGGGPKRINRIIHSVHNLFPELVELRYDRAFVELEKRCRKRSLVILVSNLFDDVNAQIVADHLGNVVGRHLPLGVFLRDQDIFALADLRRIPVLGCTSAAAAALLSWRERALAGLRLRGVLTLDVFPDELTAPLINQYLQIKRVICFDALIILSQGATMNPFDPPSRGDENPYAPPETDLRERHDRTLTAITGFEPVEPFSIDNVIRRSWRIYQKRLGITLAIVIGVWALNVGYQIFSSLLLLGLTGGDVHSPVSGPLQIVLGIAGYALSFFLTAGQAVALLRLARNRDASLGDVFGAGRYFWRMLGRTLLIGLLMIPITFVSAPAGADRSGGDVRRSGSRRPRRRHYRVVFDRDRRSVRDHARLFQYLYVLVDDDCGAFECIQ